MADMNRDLADALDTLRAIARGPQRRTRDAHDVALALQRARGMSAAKKAPRAPSPTPPRPRSAARCSKTPTRSARTCAPAT
jgi:hypothetical protein